MKEEIWKVIIGYEGKYEVSNFGRIRSLPRYVRNSVGSQTFVDGKILAACKGNAGYIHVILSDNNYHKKRWLVHRLVALAFIPNPHNYPVVNHKDENKSNNNVDNLEWCTQSYNLSYREGQRKRRMKKIEMYDRTTGEYLRTFDSIDEASRTMGINRTTICNVAAGKPNNHSAGGYIWRFADEKVRRKRGLCDEIVVLDKYPRKRKVKMIDKDSGVVVSVYNTISEAARKNNIPERQIQAVCSHKKYHHTAGGYIWQYAD